MLTGWLLFPLSTGAMLLQDLLYWGGTGRKAHHPGKKPSCDLNNLGTAIMS